MVDYQVMISSAASAVSSASKVEFSKFSSLLVDKVVISRMISESEKPTVILKTTALLRRHLRLPHCSVTLLLAEHQQP